MIEVVKNQRMLDFSLIRLVHQEASIYYIKIDFWGQQNAGDDSTSFLASCKTFRATPDP